ncbi:hypothetical protein [uncultured Sphingomonas sp.]|nr:hypothetical protein [uncultured Sphingomonas sp.]
MINSAAANLSGWQDRLVVGAVLCIALALARSWAQDQSATVATRSAAAVA